MSELWAGFGPEQKLNNVTISGAQREQLGGVPPFELFRKINPRCLFQEIVTTDPAW